MALPVDRKVAEAFVQLDEGAREFFEERAAIMEYMGRIPREEAERCALEETRKYIESRSK